MSPLPVDIYIVLCSNYTKNRAIYIPNTCLIKFGQEKVATVSKRYLTGGKSSNKIAGSIKDNYLSCIVMDKNIIFRT